LAVTVLLVAMPALVLGDDPSQQQPRKPISIEELQAKIRTIIGQPVQARDRADEPTVKIRELIRQAAKEWEIHDSWDVQAMRSHLKYHESPILGNTKYCLVVTWFDENARRVLLYTVTDTGHSEDVRFIYNHAWQDGQEKQLPYESFIALRDDLLPT